MTIGRAEQISLPELGVSKVYAKTDTGADLSTIWATRIREEEGVLKFRLFSKKSPHYTGITIKVQSPDYLLTRVASSFGHKELRYVIKIKIKVKGKTVRATFSLSDRRKKNYPILIGRKLLNGKFIVDVSKGTPLRSLEYDKKKRMRKELEVFNRWERAHEDSHTFKRRI